MDPISNSKAGDVGYGKLLEGSTEIVPNGWGGPTPNLQDLYGVSSRERTLGDYWRILRKRKWTIIAALVVVITAAGLISLRMTPIYDASVRITISSQNPSLLKFKDEQETSYSADKIKRP